MVTVTIIGLSIGYTAVLVQKGGSIAEATNYFCPVEESETTL